MGKIKGGAASSGEKRRSAPIRAEERAKSSNVAKHAVKSNLVKTCENKGGAKRRPGSPERLAARRHRAKRQKYGNAKTPDPMGGAPYDSKAEARVGLALARTMRLPDGREIESLERQVRFELLPAQRGADGKVAERRVDYVADFVAKLKDGGLAAIDVKGFRTPEYVIKRKLMLYRHGIRIIEL